MKRPVCYTIQFASILVVLLAVLLQGLTHAVNTKPLHGYTDELDTVPLRFSTYYDGTFQDFLTDYAKENTGFREFLIRNYNQIAYTCFNKITNDNVVCGKNKELYLKMYLEEITGERLLVFYPDVEAAKAEARSNVEATLRLIDTLHRHGTEFLFVFAPSKTAVYPEFMPTTYQRQIADFSLEEYYIQLFKEHGIPHIDFLNYFKSLKDHFPYPLYARTGTHWSEASIPMVADTLLRTLEDLTGYQLPSIEYLDPNPTSDYSVQDGELEGQLNLLFPIEKPALPRPVFTLTDTVGKDRPNLLVIGDSYFIQLRNSCFVEAFHQWDYWKYNRDIASSNQAYNGREVKYLIEAPKVLKEADIVMAVFTAPCFYQYMYGFPESAMELYARDPDDLETTLRLVMQEISDNPGWMQAVERQAKERGLSTEENLRRNAMYVITERKKKANN